MKRARGQGEVDGVDVVVEDPLQTGDGSVQKVSLTESTVTPLVDI
jgi:hypothetical protein